MDPQHLHNLGYSIMAIKCSAFTGSFTSKHDDFPRYLVFDSIDEKSSCIFGR